MSKREGTLRSENTACWGAPDRESFDPARSGSETDPRALNSTGFGSKLDLQKSPPVIRPYLHPHLDSVDSVHPYCL